MWGFKEEFVAALNKMADEPVNQAYINAFIAQIFCDKEQLADLAKTDFVRAKHFEQVAQNVESISTRTLNQMLALRESIESGVGQDSYRGSKLWLLNGVTNYTSNEYRYKDEGDKFRKNMPNGVMTKKQQLAFDTLLAV